MNIKILALAAAFGILAAANATACVSANSRHGQYWIIENRCPYDITANYTLYNSSGGTGRIRSGRNYLTAQPANRSFDFNYCETESLLRRGCSLSPY